MAEIREGRTKKQPERQCMGCNEKKLKADLIRIVRDPEGVVTLDFTGKKSGRGAYICHNAACLKKVRKSGRIGKILGCEITEAVWLSLEEAFSLDK